MKLVDIATIIVGGARDVACNDISIDSYREIVAEALNRVPQNEFITRRIDTLCDDLLSKRRERVCLNPQSEDA